MIHKALTEANITASRILIIPIRDLHVHMMWVAEVKGYCPKFDKVYSNEPLTRRLFLEAGFPVESIPFHERRVYLATKIRKHMLEEKSWSELVPKSVDEYIQQIDGVGRLKDLVKKDNFE
jgi:nicotinamide-nucleotide adenylyltransferase